MDGSEGEPALSAAEHRRQRDRQVRAEVLGLAIRGSRSVVVVDLVDAAVDRLDTSSGRAWSPAIRRRGPR